MRNERFGDRGGFQPRSFAPVKVGEEMDVTIEAVGEKGDGIAKKNGFVLFVAGTKQGDNVKIRVTRVLRKVGFAEVVGQGSGQPTEAAASQAEETPAEEGGESPEGSSQEGSEEAHDTEDFGEEENQ